MDAPADCRWKISETSGSGVSVSAVSTSQPGTWSPAAMIWVKLPTLKCSRGSATKVPRRASRHTYPSCISVSRA